MTALPHRRFRLVGLLVVAGVLAAAVVHERCEGPRRQAPVRESWPTASETGSALLDELLAEHGLSMAQIRQVERTLDALTGPVAWADARALLALAAHHSVATGGVVQVEACRELMGLCLRDRLHDLLSPRVRTFVARTFVHDLERGDGELRALSLLGLRQLLMTGGFEEPPDWTALVQLLRRTYDHVDDELRGFVLASVQAAGRAASSSSGWLSDVALQRAAERRAALIALAKTGLQPLEFRALFAAWSGWSAEDRVAFLGVAARHPVDPAACGDLLVAAFEDPDAGVRAAAAIGTPVLPDAVLRGAAARLAGVVPGTLEARLGLTLLSARVRLAEAPLDGLHGEGSEVLPLVCRALRGEPFDRRRLDEFLDDAIEAGWVQWNEYALLVAAAVVLEKEDEAQVRRLRSAMRSVSVLSDDFAELWVEWVTW
ncbi:MAG: hypothetical protein AB7O97_20660 [Planctomycetota bacterium]